MGNTKAVFTMPGGTVQVEGSAAFVEEYLGRLASRKMETPAPILDKGLDHAWEWFSLHARHRMQAVNFFLVAVAFLSAAYVSALRFTHPLVAAGVSVLGVLFTVCNGLFQQV